MRFVRPDGAEADTVYAAPGLEAQILVREDGRIERVCAHGVGHPIGHRRRWDDWMGVHGCDGCCAAWTGDTYGERRASRP